MQLKPLPKHIAFPDPGIYFSQNYITLDFETTNIQKGDPVIMDNHIVITSYKQGTEHYCNTGNEYEIGHIVKLCEEADFIIAQNTKFELGWLRRAGADLTKIVVFDTMLAEYIIAGNRGWGLSLNQIAKRKRLRSKGKYISAAIAAGVCPSKLPLNELIKYGSIDVELAHQIFLLQLTELQKNSLLPVMYTRCLFTPVLADLEFNGIHLDKQSVTEAYIQVVNEYQDVTFNLDKLTGGINPNSSDQVADFLYNVLKFEELKYWSGKPKRNKASKKWPEGKPKTDSDTILSLKVRTKKQQQFAELKKKQSTLNAELTKALKKFYDCVENDDLLYANFNQHITDTHRLSCNGKPPYNTQLQNIKRSHKKFVTPRKPGWKIRSNDYEQLEFICGGFLTQDPQVLYDKTHGVDIHRYTASIIFDKPEDAITKEERTAAKACTFGPTFGKQKGKTQRETDYYTAFRNKYHVMTSTQDKWINEVVRTGKLITANGLIFYWPDTKITSSGFITNSNNIRNYPIQYFSASEIANVGTLFLWHYLKAYETQSFLINTVHDSNVLEEHPEESELVEKLSKYAMQDCVKSYLNQVYSIDYNYPLIIESKAREHW